MHLTALISNEDPTPIFSTPETKVSNKMKEKAMTTLFQPSSALKAVVRNAASDAMVGAEVALSQCVRLFVECIGRRYLLLTIYKSRVSKKTEEL